MHFDLMVLQLGRMQLQRKDANICYLHWQEYLYQRSQEIKNF